MLVKGSAACFASSKYYAGASSFRNDVVFDYIYMIIMSDVDGMTQMSIYIIQFYVEVFIHTCHIISILNNYNKQ